MESNLKFALHDKYEADNSHSAEHHAQHQLGRGSGADSVADVEISLGTRFCENKRVENLAWGAVVCMVEW